MGSQSQSRSRCQNAHTNLLFALFVFRSLTELARIYSGWQSESSFSPLPKSLSDKTSRILLGLLAIDALSR